MPASPILLLVPYRNKAAVLYSQIPTSASASGDMVVSRAGVSTRINAQGLIQSVAANVPRLNYPLGGVANGCPALLVEPTATNNILQSTDSASGWTLSNSMTRATIDVIGVSGVNLTVGASGSIGSAGSRYTSPQLTPALNLALGSTYTISFFLKKTTAHTIAGYYLTIGGAAAGDIGGGFDVSGSFSSGSIYNTAGTTNRIRRVEQWGTDVFRCSETFTMTASGTIERINLGVLAVVSTTTTAPTGTTIGFAAPQLELGSVPTSFIPTAASAVTRNADIVTNNTFVIPNLIGAILTEFDSPTSGTYFLDNIPIPIASGSNKIAISYTPTTLTIYRNGAQVSGSPVTPPGGTAPVIGNVINIGHNNQLYQLGSGIKSFVLYSSTLSAAEASGLTT